VLFIGFECVGVVVVEIVGWYLKKVVFELGGFDFFIVLSSDDFDVMVDVVVVVCFDNIG